MKRDIRLMVKREKDISKLIDVLDLLSSREPMPAKYKDHQLKGKLRDFRECHIEPDWLLLYQIFEDELILSAVRTGTHSDLLKL
jgi:mRNA interferase YafQ